MTVSGGTIQSRPAGTRLRIASVILSATLTDIPYCVYTIAITVNDISLHYEDSGSGDVVMFVHGAISARRVWNSYRKAISAERRFVACDQRHFCESRPHDENAVFSADAHADDLIGFMEKLISGTVILVSCSCGVTSQHAQLSNGLVFFEHLSIMSLTSTDS